MKIQKFIAISAVIMAVGQFLSSCVSENPFLSATESGNGTLKIVTAIRGEVQIDTRSDDTLVNQVELENNLVVYIERLGNSGDEEAGLVRKYIGLHTIPNSISLSPGEYVVEGWTGDSVSASWDTKFYRGYQPATIKSDDTNSVQLHCNIANVIVSVDAESLNAGLTDINLTFHHSRKGEGDKYVMTFGEEEINTGSKAYFMMPTADHITGAKESVIDYTITGKTSDGSDFIKEGQLSGVQSAHEYKVKVIADQSNTTLGGALVKLEIEDIPVIESKIEVFPAPTYEIYYGTDPIDPSAQIDLTSGDVYTIYLKAIAYKGVKDVRILFSDNLKVNSGNGEESLNDVNDISLYNNNNKRDEIQTRYGIKYDRSSVKDKVSGTENDSIAVDEVTITIPDTFLKSFVPDQEEQSITILVRDGLYSTSLATLRFATSQEALDAPVGTVDPTKNVDYRAITPYSATLYGEVLSEERAQNFGIRYREIGSAEWTDIPASISRASKVEFSVHVSGLKPATKYEYKAYCDGFEEQKSRSFITESIYQIPDASFEEWSTYSAVVMKIKKDIILPGASGNKETAFWGSGNEGAAAASKVLTNKSTDMVHSGTYSARLASDAAMGIIAAGNIFTGYYVETDGTNGVLSVGRPYNGSHPTKLKVWANYRPGNSVTVKDGNEKYLPDGFANGNDHGQIYVALTDEPVEIRTNPSKRKLFDAANDTHVLAYGEVTWTGNFGEDGALSPVEIEIKYNDRAKTVKPTHLVIVCSASKYGDYFCGSKTSVMYLDDFELEY